MCGIIGITGKSEVTDRLIDGLRRLEYRGYDSAGIAVLNDGKLERARAKGKIQSLSDTIKDAPIDGAIGIAHTRWATHGEPSIANAHPHFAGKVGVVHNGIIENYQEIRDKLAHRTFTSETDTEVIAHLMDENLKTSVSHQEAFFKTLQDLRGAYALGLIIDGDEETLYAARCGSPLAIGIGSGEMYIGSDALALAELSEELIYLEEGDRAILTPGDYTIFDDNNTEVRRDITIITGGSEAAKKGEYEHFMLKEIYEQTSTTAQTLSAYISHEDTFTQQAKSLDFTDIDRILIIACGTACYAGHVAKYWFEQHAKIPVDVDVASEFRYRQPVLSKNSLFVAVSQSGETADTLAALRYCKEAGLKTAALVNVMTSTMAREADIALPLNAGPEIGVASTKAFTSQLTALAALALVAGQSKGQLSDADIHNHVQSLMGIPGLVADALKEDDFIKTIAKDLSGAKSAFFLGRGAMVPIAFEGALKLKEISYIHAEGYAAGELKHGPIALIEKGTPVVVIAPEDELFEKTVSNMQEVIARGAKIFLITDYKGAEIAGQMADHVITLPVCEGLTAPIIMTIAAQLLAYHTAVHLGTDVDQPRNLAKSVTVE